MKPFLKISLFFALAFSAAAMAQPTLYVEGTHYEVLDKPVRTADPNKIEVTEVFWYGCAHCYAFEPLVKNWAKNRPADVAFVRSPGMWNELMQIHAQIFYTAEALDMVDGITDLAFNEIHQKQNYLQTQDEVRALFVSQGVSAADFDKTWSSFAVTSAVKKANTRMRDYGIRGVPNMVVNGKYRVTGDGTSSQADILKIVDFLVAKERNAS